jgi:hypothetical protein
MRVQRVHQPEGPPSHIVVGDVGLTIALLDHYLVLDGARLAAATRNAASPRRFPARSASPAHANGNGSTLSSRDRGRLPRAIGRFAPRAPSYPRTYVGCAHANHGRL